MERTKTATRVDQLEALEYEISQSILFLEKQAIQEQNAQDNGDFAK